MMQVMRLSMRSLQYLLQQCWSGLSRPGLPLYRGILQKRSYRQRTPLPNETRQSCGGWNKEAGSNGSTTVEMVFVLAIIALVGTSVFSFSSAGTHALSRSLRTMHTATALTRCDDILRNAIYKVRVPFWLHECPMEFKDCYAKVYYYEGGKDSSLEIAKHNGNLGIATPGRTLILHGVELVAVEELRDFSGYSVGVKVAYRIDGSVFTTIARFGSQPVFEGQP